MELQLSGSNKKHNGRFPSISVNNNNKVVEAHTQAGTSWIYYQVGNLADYRIEWAENDRDHVFCGEGDYPKIAINDNNQVVLVYERRLREILYRVGVLNGDKIEWGKSSGYCIFAGRHPTVALRNDGKVLIAYENVIGYGTKYFTAEVSEHELNRSEPAPLFSHSVNELSLAINENNCIVAVGRTWWFKLIFKVGTFQDGNLKNVKWGEEHTFDSFKGYCPTIGINHNGQIVSMQQSVVGRHVTYRLGTVQCEDKTIQWTTNPAKHYGLGSNATVAMKNDGTVVEEHETNFSMLGLIGNKLFYRVGTIRN